MSIPVGVMLFLSQGPAHGYALYRRLTRSHGRFWSTNEGQVYGTLERLEKQGLVARRPTNGLPDGAPTATNARRPTVEWVLSARGRAAVADGMKPSTGAFRDDLPLKVLAILRDGDRPALQHLLCAQRAATRSYRDHLRRSTRDALPDAETPAAVRAAIAHLDADLTWLDQVERFAAESWE